AVGETAGPVVAGGAGGAAAAGYGGDGVVVSLVTPQSGIPADGYTRVPVSVLVRDSKHAPVTGPTRVTLEASEGMWQVVDADSIEPGVQTQITGGRGQYLLVAPDQPGDRELRGRTATSDDVAGPGFLAAARPRLPSPP